MTIRRLILLIAVTALLCSLAEVERTDIGVGVSLNLRVGYAGITGPDGRPIAWHLYLGKGYQTVVELVGNEDSLVVAMLPSQGRVRTWTLWRRKAGQ